jgi:hypothetical protein
MHGGHVENLTASVTNMPWQARQGNNALTQPRGTPAVAMRSETQIRHIDCKLKQWV